VRARAYLSFNYYVGHFLELFSGSPSRRGNFYNVSSLLNKTLVFASRIYTLSPLELSLAREVFDGVYVLRVS